MWRSEWQSPQRSMRTRTSRPCGLGVSTMVSHKGASNLTRDCLRISAIFFPPEFAPKREHRALVSSFKHDLFGKPLHTFPDHASRFAAYIRQFTRHGNKAGDGNGLGASRRIDAGC